MQIHYNATALLEMSLSKGHFFCINIDKASVVRQLLAKFKALY